MKSKMKKLVSLVLAMAMVFTMSAVVFADTTCTITVSGATDGVTYNAYKLMDLSVDSSGEAYTYTVNSKYEDILAAAMKAIGEEGEDAATYLSSYKDNDAAVQTFANKVYAALGSTTADYSEEASGTTVTFTVAQGYYLIVETDAADEDDSISLVMLETAGNSEVTAETKEDVPTLVKKIQDTNDSTGETSSWKDSADYDIGDQVPYQLTATMPDSLSSYVTYKMIFHDVMESGLTFTPSSVEVTVNGTTTVDDSCYEVLVAADGDALSDTTCTFEIVISDVKSLTSDGTLISVDANSTIVITYTAELNETAIIGNPGNWNTASLEYSNNPYKSEYTDTDNTGKTPEDTVVALTYNFTINKVDEGGDPLSGATFELYKYDYENQSWGSSLTLTATDADKTSFSATGLDDGVYKIVETKAPSGYNPIDDIYFIVTATHTDPIDTATTTPLETLTVVKATWDDDTKTATAVSGDTSFEVELSPASGETLVATDIVNKSGSILPSTGGIGTTIFYIVGAVLVLGAGVILVTRRRTRA